MKKITADLIYTLNGTPLKDHVIVLDDEGRVLDIGSIDMHDRSTVMNYKGVLTPGFVNSHCHLELSHMKGLVDTGTGLIPFLEKVVKYRDFEIDQILQSIVDADLEMYDGGIVAVGDISNKVDTVVTKQKSSIRYYTFVEMFDFMQSTLTDGTIKQYKLVYDAHSNQGGNSKSYVPHAPYTVSDELYRYIRESNLENSVVSIHNQETPDEDMMFKSKEGGFLKFFENFGFSFDQFVATGQSSLRKAIAHLDARSKTIFVHNTMTEREDIRTAHAWSGQIYWATCPNANLYIENKLPDYKAFITEGAKLTIGTDSLTSNWQLSIIEEMKTIKRYCSYVTFEQLINWACKNGAEALNYQEELGTIEIGKKPGIVHIDAEVSTDKEPNIEKAKARRIG